MGEGGELLSLKEGKVAIEPGATIILSTGDWSSYAVKGVYRVMRPMYDGIVADYLGTHPGQNGYEFEASDMTAWLVGEGYVERVSYLELHFATTYQQLKATVEIIGEEGIYCDRTDAQGSPLG